MSFKIGKLSAYNEEEKYSQAAMDSFGEIFVIAENDLPQGYADITSIENWLKIGDFLGKDYKFIRARLQEYGNVNDSTWNTYTAKQKFEICIRKATDNLQRRLDILGADYDYWMTIFDQESRKCREIRYSNAKSVLLRNISQLDTYLILSQIESDKLETRYIQHGIEGLLLSSDPIESLYNFIDATPLSAYDPTVVDAFGSPLGKYAATGIRARNVIMLPESTLSKSQMCDRILSILRNGDIYF